MTTDSTRPEDQSPEVDDALARRAITLIDLTDLADDHSVAGIDDLCSRAKTHGTAAVCVWPEHVARCVANLSGSGVRVATVVNFPTGEEPIGEVLATTQAALITPPNLIKVILESGELVDPELVATTAALAIENGADFVKTSTGKVPAGASISAATAMVGAIAGARDQGRSIGLKPSGGIRSYADAASYLDVAESVMGSGWATPATFCFGASGLLDALLEVLDGS